MKEQGLRLEASKIEVQSKGIKQEGEERGKGSTLKAEDEMAKDK